MSNINPFDIRRAQLAVGAIKINKIKSLLNDLNECFPAGQLKDISNTLDNMAMKASKQLMKDERMSQIKKEGVENHV